METAIIQAGLPAAAALFSAWLTWSMSEGSRRRSERTQARRLRALLAHELQQDLANLKQLQPELDPSSNKAGTDWHKAAKHLTGRPLLTWHKKGWSTDPVALSAALSPSEITAVSQFYGELSRLTQAQRRLQELREQEAKDSGSDVKRWQNDAAEQAWKSTTNLLALGFPLVQLPHEPAETQKLYGSLGKLAELSVFYLRACWSVIDNAVWPRTYDEQRQRA